MKMKRIASLLVAVVMLSSLSSTVFAASNETESIPNTSASVSMETGEMANSTTINLRDCAFVEIDKNGNVVAQPRISMSSHTIDAGSTIYYYNSNGNDFSINRGVSVAFKANFASSFNWECGYDSSSYTAAMGTGSSKTMSKSAKMPADGEYRFYIINNSPDTITVNSGSITY